MLRPRIQFRLRTLFVVVTLVALECAAAMWVIHDRRRLLDELDRARAAERMAEVQQLDAISSLHAAQDRMKQIELRLQALQKAAGDNR